MSRPQLLLVDSDTRNLRLLEVSLRKAGMAVITAVNGQDALEKAAQQIPDLVLSDTVMPVIDGWELCARFKQDPRLAEVPFVFLSARRAVEDKVRALELGVNDYLTKPIYVKEIVARVRMILQRRERERLERRDNRSGFSGNLADMGIVDLVQTCEIGRKTGILRCLDRRGRRGVIYFRDGRVIDAEVGGIEGEQAFYRLLDWSEGTFELALGPVERAERILVPAQGLLMEAMRRQDEWARLVESGPSLDAILVVDETRLGEVPEAAAPLLPLFDGRRRLYSVIEDGARDDLAALEAVVELVGRGALVEAAGPAPAPLPQREERIAPRPVTDLTWFVPPSDGETETTTVQEPPAAPADAEASGVFDFPEAPAGARWERSLGPARAVQPLASEPAPAPLPAPAPVSAPAVEEKPAAPRPIVVPKVARPEERRRIGVMVPLVAIIAILALIAFLRSI